MKFIMGKLPPACVLKLVVTNLTSLSVCGSFAITSIIGSAISTCLRQIESEFKIDKNRDICVANTRDMVQVKRRYHDALLVVNRLHCHFERILMAHVTFTFFVVTNLMFSVIDGNSSFHRNFMTFHLKVP